uniref:Tonsoku-like protein n=1 Tax=Anopheles christyi TaxID=43041 RepID=A0A182K632_9DIPT
MEYREQKLLKKKVKYANEDNYVALADTCLLLGELYKDREEHQRALNEYKLAAKAYEKLNKPMDRGLAFRMVGEMHSTLGQFKEALTNVQAYMRAAQREGNTKALQEAHTTLGRVYLSRAESNQRLGKASDAETDLADAEKSFRTALSICDELKRTLSKTELINMQARAHLNLGLTFDYQNQTDRAKEQMERAIRLAKEADLFELLYTCYNAMALSSSRWESNGSDDGERCGQTLRLLNLSLEVASRLPSRSTKMCQTLALMATFFLRMDDFQSARQALKRAYRLKTPVAGDAKRIARKLKVLVAMCRMEDELVTTDATNYARRKELYERMGDGACMLRNFSKAIDYYKRMLECAEANGEADRELLPCYVSLYQTYIDNREYEQALEYLWKEHSIIVNEPQEAYHTLMKIAKLYERQKKSFFTIQNVYLQAKDEAKKLESIELQRVPVQRAVKLLRANCMDLMADKLEQEAIAEGIETTASTVEPDSEEIPDQNQSLDLADYDAVEDEEEADAEHNTPNVGDDIDLEADLSDASDGDPALTIGEDLNKSSTAETSRGRKRGKRFTVRRNKKGETQLHQAAITGNKALAEQLLQLGHPVNERDYAGWLPLHEACIHGRSEIVSLLLDRGAHLNDKGGTSCEGITPLHDACRNGHMEVIKVLLDRGANATQRNDYGETALSMLDGWHAKLKVPLTTTETREFDGIRERLVAQFNAAAISVSPPLISKPSSSGRETRRQSSNGDLEGSISSSAISPSRSSRLTLTTSTNSSGYVSEIGSSSRHRNAIYDEDNDKYSSEDSHSGDDKEEHVGKRKSSTGVSEYRNVMKAMRKNHTADEPKAPSAQKKRPACRYYDEEEEKDDWLIDDMKQSAKKSRVIRDLQRTSLAGGLERSKSASSFSINRAVDLGNDPTTRFNTIVDSDDDDPFEEESEDRTRDRQRSQQDDGGNGSAFNVLMHNSAKSFRRMQQSRRNSNESRSLSLYGRRSSIQQTSLLDAGFERVASPSLEEKENLLPQAATPSPSRTPVKQSFESIVTQPVSALKCMIQVILDNGETFRVNYDEKLIFTTQTIGWLRNAVAKQYIMVHGKRPILKLKPADGSTANSFFDSDTLHVVLQSGSVDGMLSLTGQISGWEHIDLEEYYEEYCEQNKLESDKDLRKRLITMDRNQIITLEPDFAETVPSAPIPPKHVLSMVLTVAFFQQDWMNHLDLSMNGITDDDIAALVRYLPACRYLRILRLRMNLLTSRSVEMLCFGCKNTSLDTPFDGGTSSSAALGGGLLTELDLSHNPLQDAALVPLTRLCGNLPALRVLRLRSTDITHFSTTDPPSIDVSRLETFDISENKLTERSVECLLQQLTDGGLREAYFNSLPVHCENFKAKLWQTLSEQRLDGLRILNLTNCRLSDDELELSLLPAIGQNCAGLVRMDLSLNVALTKRSFLAILRCCGSAVFRLEELRFDHDVQLLVELEKSDPVDQLLQSIEYSSTGRYPQQIHAILPVSGYDEERYEKLLTVLKQLWRSLWPSRASYTNRHENRLQVTLSIDPVG